MRRNHGTIIIRLGLHISAPPLDTGSVHTAVSALRISPTSNLQARPRLSSRDPTSDFLDLIDIVYAVRRFGILRFDVQIEMSPKAGGGEGLPAEGATAIFRRFCIVWIRSRGVGRGGRFDRILLWFLSNIRHSGNRGCGDRIARVQARTCEHVVLRSRTGNCDTPLMDSSGSLHRQIQVNRNKSKTQALYRSKTPAEV